MQTEAAADRYNNYILPTSQEMRFEIAGRMVDVKYSVDKMREDFIEEGDRRGLDSYELRELAKAFQFEEDQTRKRKVRAMATVTRIAVPLRNSMFNVLYSYEAIEQGLQFLGSYEAPKPTRISLIRQDKHRPKINKTISDEAVIQNSKIRFDRLWRHEREHLLQESNKSRSEVENEELDRNRRDNSTFIKALAYGLALEGTILALDYNVEKGVSSIVLCGTSFFGLANFMGAWMVLQHYDYLDDPNEVAAREQEEKGKSRSDIFEVNIAQDNYK